MNVKKSLGNRIRGWLPKEANLASFPAQNPKKTNALTKTKLPKSAMLMFSVFTFFSVGYLLEGNAMGALFLWFTCILGVSGALDFSVSQGRELDERLVMGVLLSVISLGGILTNLYVFSVPSYFIVKTISVVVLVLVHVPLLFALAAYAWGKKDLAKKLTGWFSLQRR